MFTTECHEEDCDLCKSLIHNPKPPVFKSVADMHRYYGRVVVVKADELKPATRNFLGFIRI